MDRIKVKLNTDAIKANYYPKNGAKYAFMCLMDEKVNNILVNGIVKWFQNFDVNVLILKLNKEELANKSLILDEFKHAIKFLKDQKNIKIGIAGFSIFASLSLFVASKFEDITLNIVTSPSDFICSNFYCNDFNDRNYKKSNTRTFFDELEKIYLKNDNNRIKVENIKGTILFIGAKDDDFWNATKYIKRMKNVLLNSMKKVANARFLIYDHGTHFLFPENFLKRFSILKKLFSFLNFNNEKFFKKECLENAIDLDKNIEDAIKVWKKFTPFSDCKNEKKLTFKKLY